MIKIFIYIFITIINLNINAPVISKEKIYIAVSSNFLFTINKIKMHFEKKYECKLIISSDSTSSLYTKIINGAPFDIFISADSKHITLLEKKNITEKGKTYAYGKIVLWMSDIKKKTKLSILTNEFKNLSVSNPKLSPYGKASKNSIKNLNLKSHTKFIYGCNINQTFNFILSNNSTMGFIALSQIKHHKTEEKVYWKIQKYMYKTIEQKITILKNSKNKKLSEKFLKYLNKSKNKQIIINHGYKIKA
ncbi:MAG: molybdate ABC transporter substrate-binding protein [Enterobacteriaceae bacterium]|nr:molybdate ABC transporter substrate-binding protein [Enterobacteriaceae bacterium]